MQPLGTKLQEARLQKKISLEEAARVTKIRTSRIQEIENEDFSNFSSLAYAKGFLLIYGKYLDVDVSPYLDAFETSREVSVDGYSYLQDAPNAPPPPTVRRQSTKRPALLPLVIAIGVLVLGLYLVKLLLDIQRITPGGTSARTTATATPSPTVSSRVIAPRAQPVESTPTSEPLVTVAPTVTPTAAAAPPPSPSEPEVRRAEPVRPEDAVAPPASTPASSNEVQITPMRKTFLRVRVDEAQQSAFDGWL
ncbi:MAG: helix-turn-helix domain-containing protein, partial [Chthoniobacterales bacterium]